jgi:hypothetical protein
MNEAIEAAQNKVLPITGELTAKLLYQVPMRSTMPVVNCMPLW